MLISIKLKNWMSFRDEVSFSMVAGREKKHKEHLLKTGKANLKLLPIAAVFGANASGKSNFIKGIDFVTKLIRGRFEKSETLPVKPFKLDDRYKDEPCKFVLELLISEKIYELTIACTTHEIAYEKLTEITSTSEKILYEIENGKPIRTFAANFSVNRPLKDLKTGAERPLTEEMKQDYLQMMVLTKAKTELFLLTAHQKEIAELQKIYLEIMAMFIPTEIDLVTNILNQLLGPIEVGDFLKDLDTGIVDFLFVEEDENLPDSVKQLKNNVESIADDLIDGFTMDAENGFKVTKINGKVVGQKTQTYHLNSIGKRVPFSWDEESEGSQQLMRLALFFKFLHGSVFSPQTSKILILDEIDRSLHSQVTKKLIELHLRNCNETSRLQLIFSAHDLNLLDSKLLRRDEIWFAEREDDGNSVLTSLLEFKENQKNSNIQICYLDGRYGGLPKLVTPLMNKNVRNETAAKNMKEAE